MRMSKRVLGLAAVLVAIACAAGGYAFGAANAPTEDDAAISEARTLEELMEEDEPAGRGKKKKYYN